MKKLQNVFTLALVMLFTWGLSVSCLVADEPAQATTTEVNTETSVSARSDNSVYFTNIRYIDNNTVEATLRVPKQMLITIQLGAHLSSSDYGNTEFTFYSGVGPNIVVNKYNVHDQNATTRVCGYVKGDYTVRLTRTSSSSGFMPEGAVSIIKIDATGCSIGFPRSFGLEL